MNCSTGTCVPSLTALQKEILLNTDVLAINQDITPQGTPLKTGDSTVWVRYLSNGDVAVAFYNENDESVKISLDFTDITEWSSSTSARESSDPVARDPLELSIELFGIVFSAAEEGKEGASAAAAATVAAAAF